MKKIITLLLTLIMAVSLGSCKNSKKNKIATANELRNYLDSIELKEDYNIEVTYKSIDRNVNSKEGNTIKGIVKGYANVTSKELTQFYLYLEEISAVRTPTMYGKNVKKTISKGKVYAQKFNQEDEKDNIIYLYNYEKNVDGKNWSKVETKTKEKNVGSSYTSYFDFYTEFYNELENFYEQYNELLNENKDKILKIYRNNSLILNKEVNLEYKNSIRKVIPIDILEDGSLLIKNSNNEIEKIISGEISIRL